MSNGTRVALCLPGGGVTGAMYQIGALAALEHVVDGFDANAFELFLGASSGASVAAVLAGGSPVERMYRALLDPSDMYFPLERKHLLRTDFAEWARTVEIGLTVLRRVSKRLVTRGPPPDPAELWEELDRVSDSLPSGLFSLEAYERFLEAFFARRSIPNTFAALPRPLRVIAHDVDTGEQVVFGADGSPRATVARACIASTAFTPIFAPVRIGERHYIDAGPAQVAMLDVAASAEVDLLLVVNPLVAVHGGIRSALRPSGGVRDRGAFGVMSQMLRIVTETMMRETCARLTQRVPIVVLEPEPTDAVFFEPNPASFAARRVILEHAYRTTRSRVHEALERSNGPFARAGWRLRAGLSVLPPRPEEAQ